MSEEINEYAIRQWMKTADLAEVKDLLAAGRVIVEMREEFQPRRKRRKDAGQSRKKAEPTDKMLEFGI